MKHLWVKWPPHGGFFVCGTDFCVMSLCEQDHPFLLDYAPLMATEIEEFIL